MYDIELKYENAIPVVFATDKNFIPYLYVAIQSLVDNSSEKNNYDIVILYSNVEEYKRNQFKALEKENISIRFYDMSELMAEYKDVWYTHWSYTDSVYYRFFIPQLFKNYKKVLFMDADIIINCDIANLYYENIGENQVGAVVGLARQVDEDWHRDYIENVLQIEYDKYFNAGIIVFNIEKIDTKFFSDTCINKLVELKDPPMQDQDVFNLIFKNKVRYLNCSYNLTWNCIHYWDDFEEKLGVSQRKDYIEACKNPKIIHYAGKYKPWEQPHLAYADYFWKYARKTPFYEEIIYKNVLPKTGRQTIYNVIYRKRIYMSYLRCKLLKMITFGKKREHYISKIKHLENMVKDYRKTLQK